MSLFNVHFERPIFWLPSSNNEMGISLWEQKRLWLNVELILLLPAARHRKQWSFRACTLTGKNLNIAFQSVLKWNYVHNSVLAVSYQSFKKIIDLDLKDQDHLMDLDLFCDLDHYWWSFKGDLDLWSPYLEIKLSSQILVKMYIFLSKHELKWVSLGSLKIAILIHIRKI